MSNQPYHICVAFLVAIHLLAACGDSGAGAADGPSDSQATDTSMDGDTEAPQPELLDLVRFVAPLIGTAGPGNVIPGPSLPHGMVKLSPDTAVEPGSVDAYEYGSDHIEGFSHTHLEGPGGGGYGYSEILLLPTTGPLPDDGQLHPSLYSHETEVASPGYYAVTLDDHGVRVELTATHRCGYHRYTFPKADQAHILLDLGHSRGRSDGGKAEVVGNTVVRGWGVYNVHPALEAAGLALGENVGRKTVYFDAEFSSPFDSVSFSKDGEPLPDATAAEGKNLMAALRYTPAEGDVIEVRVGISLIGVEQAEQNRRQELAGRSFQQIRQQTSDSWNELLNRIRVTGTEPDRVKFYTALYHALLQPVDYTEGGRFWSGFDGSGAVSDADGFNYYSDDWCMWDTFRTTHPLQTLVEPERSADKVQSYLHMYEQGGWLPKCPWQATGYSRVMIGNHTNCFIADTYLKGIADFDVAAAYEAMRKSAMEDDIAGLFEGLLGYFNYGTLPSYIDNGYVPHEDDQTQSVSMTLEYAYNDWCLARMAEALGNEEDHAYFAERARNYVKHWDATVGFMRPRLRDGSWLTPFDPTSDMSFCEADAWIYTWFVPHDVQGLIALFGSEQAFVEKLDVFFDEGHFDPTNQPDFHAPYLYAWAAAPAKTQQRVRHLVETEFTTLPSGLPGNDDAGATSAWLVFAALGLYPVSPGSNIYVLSGPIFDEAVIQLDGHTAGARFVIEARDNSPQNVYIQSATLDGLPLDRAWITHAEIIRGGRLVLQLGPSPSNWGTSSPPQSP